MINNCGGNETFRSSEKVELETERTKYLFGDIISVFSHAPI